MNLRSVLLSIQSLLHEFPVINEPGFEETNPEDQISIDYNHYLIYYNYKIAILNILNNLENPINNLFKNEIENEFKINFKKLSEHLQSYQIIIGEKIVDKVIYFIRKSHHLDFVELNNIFHQNKYLFEE